MAGKCRITVLILVITAFAVAGCSLPPMGSIGEGLSSTRSTDSLLVRGKTNYKKGEVLRWTDLTMVSVVSREGEIGLSVTPTDVRIRDPATSQPKSVDRTSGYELTTAGEKIVMVNYNSLSSQYYIVVEENPDIVTSQPSGIIIIWADD